MKKRENKKIIKLYSPLILASLIIFAYTFIDINKKWFLYKMDLKINSLFSEINNEIIISTSKFVTNLFNPIIFVIMTLIIIVFLFHRKRNKEAFVLASALVTAKLFSDTIKLIVSRERPENILVNELSYSFPSAHALMAVIFFGILVYLFDLHIKSNKKKLFLSFIAIIFTIIMGLTRIILNAHYFTDVLAGFALGIFLLFSFIIIVKKEHILR
jgi:undecaprenyl-diphosphatase